MIIDADWKFAVLRVLFALPVCVIGRPCSVIATLRGHHYHFSVSRPTLIWGGIFCIQRYNRYACLSRFAGLYKRSHAIKRPDTTCKTQNSLHICAIRTESTFNCFHITYK